MVHRWWKAPQEATFAGGRWKACLLVRGEAKGSQCSQYQKGCWSESSKEKPWTEASGEGMNSVIENQVDWSIVLTFVLSFNLTVLLTVSFDFYRFCRSRGKQKVFSHKKMSRRGRNRLRSRGYTERPPAKIKRNTLLMFLSSLAPARKYQDQLAWKENSRWLITWANVSNQYFKVVDSRMKTDMRGQKASERRAGKRPTGGRGLANKKGHRSGRR